MRYALAPLLAAIMVSLPGMAWAQEALVTLHKATPDYRLELDIGPPAHMYSRAMAARLKPTSGEIMASGHMIMLTKASFWRHLELHVWSKASGKVVKNADVTIKVDDLATGKTETLPISAMYGIRAGLPDWHYGNNVMMPPGQWQVNATINGEKTTFDVTMKTG